MQLRGTGIWSGGLRYGDRGAAADAAAELEALGYSALWVPDVGGNLFGSLANLLGATTKTVVATGILNLWMHDAAEVGAKRAELVGDGPSRLLLGIGASHAMLIDNTEGLQYAKPYSKMVEYLDALDAAEQPVPVAERVLAALGPKMLALAATRAAGAHPYLAPPENTARARAALGPAALLCPEQPVVLTGDADLARETARRHLAGYLMLPNYTNNLRRAGFDDADFADGGSERLVDTLVAWGDETAIAGRVRAHRDAGADHVCIQVLPTDPAAALPLDDWRALAPALV
jgi:probable F420-dependent oxidoreductase